MFLQLLEISGAFRPLATLHLIQITKCLVDGDIVWPRPACLGPSPKHLLTAWLWSRIVPEVLVPRYLWAVYCYYYNCQYLIPDLFMSLRHTCAVRCFLRRWPMTVCQRVKSFPRRAASVGRGCAILLVFFSFFSLLSFIWCSYKTGNSVKIRGMFIFPLEFLVVAHHKQVLLLTCGGFFWSIRLWPLTCDMSVNSGPVALTSSVCNLSLDCDIIRP